MAKLDYGKIREHLSGLCMLPGAKEIAESLVPSADLHTVRQTLRETDEGRILLRLNPLFSVRGAREIRPYLERCERGGILNPAELLEIRDTLKAARQIRQTILESKTAEKESYQELFSLRQIIERIIPQKEIEDGVSRCIAEDGNIQDRASDELARLRRALKTGQQRIKDGIEGILRNPNYQKMLQDSVVTLRGDRYVVPVKLEYSSAFPGIVHDQSASGATVFVEPLAVVRLGNELREVMLKEDREMQRILQQLALAIAVKVPELFILYEALARLDFILGKARLSEKMEGGSPHLADQPIVKLVRARHPLLNGPVVPISVELGKEYRFIIITGPNTGGKTVTLKTVGLMVVMAQSGLHIPVEGDSGIGIFKRVFVDIGDEQSVEQSLSTFSGHMKNIVEIMEEADRDSLVLFDELGAGTDPAEGAALAMALLKELLTRRSCGIATTHYGALKTFAYETPGVENASVEFDSETLKPTYRLLIGVPGRSNALAIAQRLGLDQKILAEARAGLSERQSKESDLLENLEESQRAIEITKVKVEDEYRQARQRSEEIKNRNLELDEKVEEIIRKAKEEAVEIVRRARTEAGIVIKEIKEAQKLERRAQDTAMAKARQGLKQLSENTYGTKAGKNHQGIRPEQLEIGQAVYLPNLGQKGQVLQKPDNNNEVLILAGILKINVPVSELRIIDETRKTEHFANTIKGSFGLSKAAALRSEIDLRGKLVEEAEELLDKYLDDAVITGINQVSVIHGKGTGALRAGIHLFLKKHPHVKAYRLGEYGEGDTGVTIVDLK